MNSISIDSISPKVAKVSETDDIDNLNKRAPSPFIVFCNVMKHQLKEEFPSYSFGEIGKILSKRWNLLSEVEKTVLLLSKWFDRHFTVICHHVALRQRIRETEKWAGNQNAKWY